MQLFFYFFFSRFGFLKLNFFFKKKKILSNFSELRFSRQVIWETSQLQRGNIEKSGVFFRFFSDFGKFRGKFPRRDTPDLKLKHSKKGVPGGPEIPGFPGGGKFREISGKFVQICQNRGFFDQKFSYRHVATAGKPRNDPPEISVFEKTQKNGIFRYFSTFFENFGKISKNFLKRYL